MIHNIVLNSDTFIIHGNRWQGKTVFASSVFAYHYKYRLYSNFQIFQYWKSITNYYDTYEKLSSIQFSPTRWILILDEWWFNFSVKSWKTKENNILREFMFLSRKLNLSLVFIAQNYENLEPDSRRSCDYIFEVSKILREDKHPLFEITRQTEKKIGETWFILEPQEINTVDLISFQNQHWLTYNQLEASKLS